MFDYTFTMPTAPALDSILAAKAREDDAARELLVGVAEWADAHTTGALMPDLYGTYGAPDEEAYAAAESTWVARFGMPGADTMLELAGAGAPEVSDFAVTELSVALGRSRESGRLLVGDVVEAKHRLPKVWARLVAGQVTAWRVRRLAQATRGLSEEAVAFVDAQVAHVVHTAGPATIHRLVLEAAARFDPESVEVTECDTQAALCFDIDLGTPATSIGTANGVHAYGLIDRADAEDLEAAVRQIAHQLTSTAPPNPSPCVAPVPSATSPAAKTPSPTRTTPRRMTSVIETPQPTRPPAPAPAPPPAGPRGAP